TTEEPTDSKLPPLMLIEVSGANCRVMLSAALNTPPERSSVLSGMTWTSLSPAVVRLPPDTESSVLERYIEVSSIIKISPPETQMKESVALIKAKSTRASSPPETLITAWFSRTRDCVPAILKLPVETEKREPDTIRGTGDSPCKT